MIFIQDLESSIYNKQIRLLFYNSYIFYNSFITIQFHVGNVVLL